MKSFIAVIMCLFIYSSTYSQENPKTSSYALSFGIADNFRLDKFNMDIAVKKIIDETHQLRLFLSPYILSRDEEENVSGNQDWRTATLFNYSLGIGADYLWVILQNEDIRMFSGTGLYFTFGNNNDKDTHHRSEGDIITFESNDAFFHFGLRGILGVEWMVSKSIGIHSEYLVKGTYRHEKIENENTTNHAASHVTNKTSNGIFLNSYVLFGISIYL